MKDRGTLIFIRLKLTNSTPSGGIWAENVIYYCAMDEKTNSKIEELKRNPPNRFLPVLVLFFVVAAVFLYRVAVTDPEWNASAPAAKATSVQAKVATGAPAARTAKSAAAQEAASANTKSANATAAASSDADAVASAPAEDDVKGEDAGPKPAAGASAEGTSAVVTDDYLERHVNRTVPFIYKGETREVTLSAFTHSTVTIRRGNKALTLNRSELSPKQLELWK